MPLVKPKPGLLNAIRARLALSALNLLVRLVHGRLEFKGVEVSVPRGCFAPVFVSTSLLYDSALSVVGEGGLGCEIGTGVGSLALALAKTRGVEIVGTDVDLKCLRAAWRNARANKLDSLFHAVACLEARPLRDCSFDFVVINPPYLPLAPRGPAGAAACGGWRLEVLNAMLQEGVRVVKWGGPVVFTASSLTSVEGAELLGERWALFDSVQSYLHVKQAPRPHEVGFTTS